MKRIYYLLFTLLLSIMAVNAQVTIGSSEEPQAFSILELISSEANVGGLRLPQMSEIERNEMTNGVAFQNQKKGKAIGLTIYNTTTNTIEFWNGSEWASKGTGEDWVWASREKISFNKSAQTVNSSGNTSIIKTNVSTGWSVIGVYDNVNSTANLLNNSGSWIKISKEENDVLRILLTENTSGSVRSGVIEVKGGSATIKINVEQTTASGSEIYTFTSTASTYYSLNSTKEIKIYNTAPWEVISYTAPQGTSFKGNPFTVGKTGEASSSGKVFTLTTGNVSGAVIIRFVCTLPGVSFENPNGKDGSMYYKEIRFQVGTGQYSPVANAGWAGSNIYFMAGDNPNTAEVEDGYLTFDIDPRGHYKTGTYFLWGSLVGIKNEGVGYISSTNLLYPKEYTQKWNKGPNAWPGTNQYEHDLWGYEEEWITIEEIPYAKTHNFTESLDEAMGKSALLGMHAPEDAVGDICKYISDKGWAPDLGSWRMPTASEFGKVSDYKVACPYGDIYDCYPIRCNVDGTFVQFPYTYGYLGEYYEPGAYSPDYGGQIIEGYSGYHSATGYGKNAHWAFKVDESGGAEVTTNAGDVGYHIRCVRAESNNFLMDEVLEIGDVKESYIADQNITHHFTINSSSSWTAQIINNKVAVKSFSASGYARMGGVFSFVLKNTYTDPVVEFVFTNDNQTKTVAINIATGKPTTHQGWAASNIYWNGTHLTFDVNDTGSQNKQGVFFKWGSLVGIQPVGSTYDTSMLYFPSEYLINEHGGKTPSLTYANIPYVTDNPSVKDRNVQYLINHSVHIPELGKGDICKYISDNGWIQDTYNNNGEKVSWRLPTSTEFGAAANYENVGKSTAQTTVDTNGQDAIGYSKRRKDITSGVIPEYPASGFRTNAGKLNNIVGTTGYYWSGSPSTATAGYHFSFTAAASPADSRDRQIAMPVRCVRAN